MEDLGDFNQKRSRFWLVRFFKRLWNRWKEDVEADEPIEDFQNDDLQQIDRDMKGMIGTIGTLGGVQNKIDFFLEQINGQISIKQDELDDAVAKGTPSDNIADSLARLKIRRQKLLNSQAKLKAGLEDGNIMLQAKDQEGEDLEARYVDAVLSNELADLDDSANASMADLNGFYRTGNRYHIGKVEERVREKEGRVRAQGEAITGVLDARGQSIKNRKRVLSSAAQAELDEARKRLAQKNASTDQSTASTSASEEK